jgi:Lar family restriction alleviation protein
MTELKDCPFCGAPALMGVIGFQKKFHFVACTECKCGTDISLDEKKSVKEWNKRVRVL